MKDLTVKALAISLFSLLITYSANAGPVKIRSTYDPSKNPSFESFRKSLKKAVELRDKRFILSILDEENLKKLSCSNGDTSAKTGFSQLNSLDDPNAIFWEDLKKLISLDPIELSEDTFRVPYYVFNAQDSKDSKDSENKELAYVLVDGLSMREKPTPNSNIQVKLSYDLIEIDYSTVDVHCGNYYDNYCWLPAKFGSLNGYVHSKYIGTNRDPYVVFKKFSKKGDEKTQWKMILNDCFIYFRE